MILKALENICMKMIHSFSRKNLSQKEYFSIIEQHRISLARIINFMIKVAGILAMCIKLHFIAYTAVQN